MASFDASFNPGVNEFYSGTFIKKSFDGAFADAAAPGGGIGAPVISDVSPPSPGPLGVTREAAISTPVSFVVTDDDPRIALVLITLKYQDVAETLVVHDGTNFLPPFNSGSSSRTVIGSTVYAYTILPVGGWSRSIEALTVHRVDGAGNVGTP